MRFALRITFRHMERSSGLESRIRELATRLEKFSEHILNCHVIVEPPTHHQHQGLLYGFS